tara:strand:- start:695 stop:1099 length:405 start_codon:yes stop_codon:yes gene_type:complete
MSMSKKFFVKIVTDPDVDLRKCVVGLACAAQAISDGYEVDMFFAADGVKMLNSKYISGINESGTLPEGMIFGMIKTITEGAKNIYCSTGSQAANGVTKENADSILLTGYQDWMTWSGPPGVIALSAESDVQLVY